MPSSILSDNGVSSGTSGIKTTGANDGQLALQTTTAGGTATTALTIDTSQNVGIGTSSPGTRLQINGTASQSPATVITSAQTGTTVRSNSVFRIQSEASGRDVYMQFSDNVANTTEIGMLSGSQYFCTNSTERMRIDSSGRVGIGTSSPVSSARASFGNSSGTLPNLWAAYFGTNSDGAAAAPDFGLTIGWNKSGGGGESNIVFGVNAGTTPGLAFSSSNGTTVTERARITSDGILLIGTTSSVAGSNTGLILQAGNGNTKFSINSTANVVQLYFYNPNGIVGSITTSGTATAYNISSDYRLKENIRPMTGALAKVAQLKPCTYTWKTDGADGEGFIAHELAEVCPQAVSGEKDAVFEDGSMKPQGVDSSFLVATLTAAIQELNAKVEAQAAEIAALKAKER